MERQVFVKSAEGLHARPAAQFVALAAAAPVPVFLARPGQEPVPANSILAVLTLGLGNGEAVVLSAGPGAPDGVLDPLCEFLEGPAS